MTERSAGAANWSRVKGRIAFVVALSASGPARALAANSRSECASAVPNRANRKVDAPTSPNTDGGVAGKPAQAQEDGFRHDGFFARAEVSLALLSAHIDPNIPSTRRTGIRAWGQSSQISFGGTPLPGFVVGGLLGAGRLDPAFIEAGQRIVPDDDSVKVSLVRLGPFIDWYPNPRRGFHSQIALALAVLVESDFKGNPLEPAAIGPSASVGLGQEWFLAHSWSLGLFGRLSFGRLSRTVERSPERVLWQTLDIGITSTYH